MCSFDETIENSWIALDIGGANLKLADGCGFARTMPFELWHRHFELETALSTLLSECPPFSSVAVTMTGELADCYRTKAEGVRHIVDAVESAATGATGAGECAVQVYLTDGSLVAPAAACEAPLLAAASNWHALATFCSQLGEGRTGVLLDMGSTTTDVIPFSSRGPVAQGHTDPERLVAGELVYTGVTRSPICSMVDALLLRGMLCPIAQEVFATTVDAYLTLGDITSDPENCHTADGRPRTTEAARDRLARCICADRTMFSRDDAMRAAEEIREQQLALLEKSVTRVVSRHESPEVIVISGDGEFLLRKLVERCELSGEVVSLSERLGPAASQCAPAHALATIARQGALA